MASFRWSAPPAQRRCGRWSRRGGGRSQAVGRSSFIPKGHACGPERLRRSGPVLPRSTERSRFQWSRWRSTAGDCGGAASSITAGWLRSGLARRFPPVCHARKSKRGCMPRSTRSNHQDPLPPKLQSVGLFLNRPALVQMPDLAVETVFLLTELHKRAFRCTKLGQMQPQQRPRAIHISGVHVENATGDLRSGSQIIFLRFVVKRASADAAAETGEPQLGIHMDAEAIVPFERIDVARDDHGHVRAVVWVLHLFQDTFEEALDHPLSRAPSFSAAATIRREISPICSSVKLFSIGWSVTSKASESPSGVSKRSNRRTPAIAALSAPRIARSRLSAASSAGTMKAKS